MYLLTMPLQIYIATVKPRALKILKSTQSTKIKCKLKIAIIATEIFAGNVKY